MSKEASSLLFLLLLLLFIIGFYSNVFVLLLSALFWVYVLTYLIFPCCTANRETHANMVELPVWSSSPKDISVNEKKNGK